MSDQEVESAVKLAIEQTKDEERKLRKALAEVDQ
jgi:hypothetical protein